MTSKEIEIQLQDLDHQENIIKSFYTDAIVQYGIYFGKQGVINSKRGALRKQLAEAKLDESPDDIAFILKYDPASETMKSHQVLERIAEEHGLYHGGGYWSDTMQFVLKVKLDHHESPVEALKGIRFFIPYMKLHKDGYFHFDIFEHTLSYYGSYHLVVTPDGESAEITCTRWSKNEPYFKGSLEGALQKISEDVWYE